MVVDKIRLHAESDVVVKEKIGAAAESIENRPVRFLPRRRQLLNNALGNQIAGSGVRRGNFVDGSEVGPQKRVTFVKWR